MASTMNTSLTNEEIGRILEEIGQLLDITGETPFKSRAYFNAVHIVHTLDVPIQTLVEQGKLSSIKGFGKALTQKITELVKTGQLKYYEKLKASVPPGLFEIAALPGLDRRRTGVLHLKLGIGTIEELERACLQNQIAAVRGFSLAQQQQLLETIRSQKPTGRESSCES